jgi:hypothetical protein
MRWSDLPLKPSPRMLRQFAGLWIVFFGLMALWKWLGQDNTQTATILGALAVTVGPLGLVAPQAIRPIFIGWLVLAFPIGWVISRAVLLTLFFGVMFPIGVLFRAIGRDELKLRRMTGRESYWAAKAAPNGLESYFRQF